eukprot:2255816-Pleurochrysis_carterae.AAC.1
MVSEHLRALGCSLISHIAHSCQHCHMLGQALTFISAALSARLHLARRPQQILREVLPLQTLL